MRRKRQRQWEDLDDLAVSAKNDAAAFDLLWQKLQPIRHALRRRYHTVKGLELEDVEQELALALHSRILRDYDKDKGRFVPFARLALGRMCCTLIKQACSQKRKALNYSTTLDMKEDNDGNDEMPCDWLNSEEPRPEAGLDHGEEIAALKRMAFHVCTRLEGRVLEQYLAGLQYDEIGRKLRLSFKTVDNALCRVKIKAQRLFDALKKREEWRDEIRRREADQERPS